METPPPQQPPQDPVPPQQPAPAPAPQPQAAYPHPGMGPSIRFDVIGQAFNMVFSDIGTWVVAALCMCLVVGVVYALIAFTIGAMIMGGGGFLALIMMELLLGVVVGSVANIMMANMYRMAIIALSGTKPSINEMFKFGPEAGNIIVAALLVGIAVAIGSIFCYIPGLVIGGLFMFTLPIVVDRKMAAGQAISLSMETLKKDVVMAAIFYLVISICAGIGAIALGIGVLFTLPVMPIAIAMLYRDYLGFASTPS